MEAGVQLVVCRVISGLVTPFAALGDPWKVERSPDPADLLLLQQISDSRMTSWKGQKKQIIKQLSTNMKNF